MGAALFSGGYSVGGFADKCVASETSTEYRASFDILRLNNFGISKIMSIARCKGVDLVVDCEVMKAYSLDLRERVVSAIDAGMARTTAAQTYRVSLGSIKRWLRLREETGRLLPRLRPGKCRTFTRADERVLRERLETVPDTTLGELVQVWNEQYGVVVSRWTIRRALKRMGWTQKKSP